MVVLLLFKDLLSYTLSDIVSRGQLTRFKVGLGFCSGEAKIAVLRLVLAVKPAFYKYAA